MKNGNVDPHHIKSSPKKPGKHTYLEGLKGRLVTLYRGGPESKSGMLLDVKSDYVTLYSQDNQNENKEEDKEKDNQNKEKENNQKEDKNNGNPVIYYRLHHLKSISEDTKSNSIQSSYEKEDYEIDFLKANTFAEIIKQHENKYIQVNQGGPEAKQGLLVHLNNDCLTLFTEDDGIVYYNLHHIKSLCEVQSDSDEDHNEKDEQGQTQRKEMTFPSYVKAQSFKDVFSHMSHKWVSINRGGPEAMEGVLVESSDGHFTLVNNQEVIRIALYHIRNISSGPKGSLKNNQNENNQSQESEKSSDGQQSQGRDSRQSHDRDSRRSHDRDTRHSRDRDSRRSYGRDTRHSHGRDTRRSHSRDTRRSHGRDTRRSHGRDTRRSHGKDTRRSHGRDTKRSHGKDSRTHRRDTRRSHTREHVIKSIDYVWKVK
ncbi:spore coat protein [Siminovitchia sediminis]|uniref:Spore coat protein n=1 Tax=Siminovitchia sediminis TaxID=1274353 RepID=A0ABW4KNQ4_9BACI